MDEEQPLCRQPVKERHIGKEVAPESDTDTIFGGTSTGELSSDKRFSLASSFCRYR